MLGLSEVNKGSWLLLRSGHNYTVLIHKVVLLVCPVSWLFLLGCQYQCKRLTGKTRLRNETYIVLMGTLNPTRSLTRPQEGLYIVVVTPPQILFCGR